MIIKGIDSLSQQYFIQTVQLPTRIKVSYLSLVVGGGGRGGGGVFIRREKERAKMEEGGGGVGEKIIFCLPNSPFPFTTTTKATCGE